MVGAGGAVVDGTGPGDETEAGDEVSDGSVVGSVILDMELSGALSEQNLCDVIRWTILICYRI